MHDPFAFADAFLAPLWAFAPHLVLGIAGLFAFKVAVIRMGCAFSGQGGPGAAAASVTLAGLALGSWALAAHALLVQRQPAAADTGAAGGEANNIVEALLYLLERFPPYSLAAAMFLLTLMVALLCPARGPGLPSSRPLDHLRQLKAELKGRKGEDAVVVILARLGLPALHDVILLDERGLTQVDHLVRMPGGIAVLEAKTYSGIVTGEVQGKQWTQHLRGKRYPFQNPVLQNHRHVEAAKLAVGIGVPMWGIVVSAGTARFCPELVPVVTKLEEVADRLAGMPGQACDPGRMDAAWRALTAAAARSPGLREAHLEQLRKRSVVAG